LPTRGYAINSPVRIVKRNHKQYDGEVTKYRVSRRDNLTKIARRFNTEVSVLLGLNQIKHPDLINLGQLLKVPSVNSLRDSIKVASNSKDAQAKIDKPARENTDSTELTTQEFKVKRAHIKSVDNANKERPAFLPVSFANTKRISSPQVGIIVVDFDETLSHYAEWSKLTVRKILNLNGMNKRSRLNVHSRIKVPFTNRAPDIFEEKRQEYHKAIQEDFFNNYKIDKLLVRNMAKGETVWEICNEIYAIPFWLLASYNPGKDINSIPVGEPIVVPIISPVRLS
jgi:membrane-bound lytic murein transglycosylase D